MLARLREPGTRRTILAEEASERLMAVLPPLSSSPLMATLMTNSPVDAIRLTGSAGSLLMRFGSSVIISGGDVSGGPSSASPSSTVPPNGRLTERSSTVLPLPPRAGTGITATALSSMLTEPWRR